MVAQVDLERLSSLVSRYDTLRNGALLRDGARSLLVGRHGANIVEIASYPGSLTSMRSPKKLLIAQTGMYNALIAVDRPEAAKACYDAFRANDAWRALTQRDYQDEDVVWASLWSVFTATLPSALLMASMIGTLLWGAGRLVEKRGSFHFPAAALGVVAALLGFLTYGLSQSVIASVALALCTAFLSYSPAHSRTNPPEDLGPLFRFSIRTLALAFLFAFAAYAVSLSTPATALLPVLGVSGEFFGNGSMFIGLSAIILGLTMLIAPMWGIVQRRRTPTMVGVVLKQFGGTLAWTSLTLALIAAPMAVFVDHSLDRTLTQLVGNEPVYYLLR